MSEESYRGPQVIKIVGITYRQLDYWARTGLAEPSVAQAQGSGTQRLYSMEDMRKLKVIKSLLDSGVALTRVRNVIEFLRGAGEIDWQRCTLVSHGKDVELITSEGDLINLLSQPGQTALSLLPLGSIENSLNATVVELFPENSANSERRAHGIG